MIKVLNPGLNTTIQDLGRFGHRSVGIPISGAMDPYALRFANQLLDNDDNDACLEATLIGPELKFECNTKIVITGAHFKATLNHKKIDHYIPINIKKGDQLKLQNCKSGVYGYIAVKGGIQSEKVLGSRSMYEGITTKTKIFKGQSLPIENTSTIALPHNASLNYQPDYFNQNIFEDYKGPEWEHLTENVKSSLLTSNFQIQPESNRMAIVLKHNMDLTTDEIITAPVQPGTVQLTPSGKLIILMRDAQTTGGYARIFQLTEKSINKISQIRPKNNIQFKVLDGPNM